MASGRKSKKVLAGDAARGRASVDAGRGEDAPGFGGEGERMELAEGLPIDEEWRRRFAEHNRRVARGGAKRKAPEERVQHEIVRSPGRDDVHEQREASQHREGVVGNVPLGRARSTPSPKRRHRHERPRPA